MLENRVEKLGDKLKIALAYASPLGVSTVKKILANISAERLMSVDLERFFFSMPHSVSEVQIIVHVRYLSLLNNSTFFRK